MLVSLSLLLGCIIAAVGYRLRVSQIEVCFVFALEGVLLVAVPSTSDYYGDMFTPLRDNV